MNFTIQKRRILKNISRRPSLIYPVVLLVIFLFLVSFKLSGTSIGVYHDFLYGTTEKDSSLVLGKPQTIRSDEWLVITQATIAQKENGFARINQNFQNKDMSILMDVPYLDWSSIFKPQNFSFFLLPLEYAFAFKWWFLLLSLLLSSYYFFLKLLPDKIIESILLSLTISFAPFVFWWYQSATILPLTYGFLILIVGMSIIDKDRLHFRNKEISSRTSATLKSLTLTYLLTNFALILYPPFQIPIALIVGMYLVGYLLNKPKKVLKKQWRFILFPLLCSIIAVGMICATFVMTRAEAIHTITNTAYPGQRVVTSGGFDIKKLLVTYLQPQIQREGKGSKYIINQSESSSFIVLPLFLMPPAIGLLAWFYIKRKEIEWVLLATLSVASLFLAQLFIPGIGWLSKLSMLYLVPQDRLVIGFGFIGIILGAYMVRLAQKYIRPNKKIHIILLGYLLLFFVLSLLAGLETSRLYPEFISNKKLILLLCSTLYSGLGLLIFNKVRLGLTIIAVFSIASVIQINPLYRGLGPFYNSEISKQIRAVSNTSSTWAAAQSIYIENLPQISGRSAVTGTAFYPDNSFWRQYADSNSDAVYNRYAHIFLSSNDSASLMLGGPDLFAVSASCSRKIAEQIDYVVSTTPLEGSCEHLIKTVPYPNVVFYIYQQ